VRVLGIDLGTTNSAVAVVNRHGVPEIIPNREGEYITPSVVFFDGAEAIVGRVAKRSAGLDPHNIVQRVKREMGGKSWRFYPTEGGEWSPEAISSLILRRLKEDAETMRGEQFTHAVISVPAYFADPERQATQDAAEMAGLTPVRIVNEPTAAALAYGLDSAPEEELVVVYDLGGGTFDASVLRVTPDEIKVLGTGGDRQLGGVDWDNAIMEWLDDQFVARGGPTLLAEDGDPRLEQDLRDKAETAKHTLSQMRQTKVVLSSGDTHQTITLTRETFEELTADLLERTRNRMEVVLEESGLRWPEVSKVLLVGGSTRMPAVGAMLEELSGIKPSREVHPDEAVALGAAVQAALVARTIEPPKPTATPGAAAPVLDATETGIKEVNIIDVTAHSLGVVFLDQTFKEYNNIVIDRGEQLPARGETQGNTLAETASVRYRLVQGEDRDLRYCKIIGEAELTFPDGPKPAGHPLLCRVAYDVDGLIHGYMHDGVTQRLIGELHISRESNLSPEELEAMKRNIGQTTLG
jgi:molecular chaperone DnaK